MRKIGWIATEEHAYILLISYKNLLWFIPYSADCIDSGLTAFCEQNELFAIRRKQAGTRSREFINRITQQQCSNLLCFKEYIYICACALVHKADCASAKECRGTESHFIFRAW